MSDIDDMSYGPIAPPGYMKTAAKSDNPKQSDDRKMPSYQGPSLPAEYKSQKQSSSDSDSDSSSSHGRRKTDRQKRKRRNEHLKSKKLKIESSGSEDSDSDSSCKSDKNVCDEYGPCLPPGYVKSGLEKDSEKHIPNTSSFIGPILPVRGASVSESHLSDEEDIGPKPAEMATGNSVNSTVHEIEKRSERMKETLHHGVNPVSNTGPTIRDEWMTQLPSNEDRSYDLVNRTFQKNPKQETGNRSVWTDTPADRERKEMERDKDGEHSGKKATEIVRHAESARDKYLSQKIEEYNKSKRPESLMEMHRKKKKKKEKKEKKDKKKKKKHKGKEKEGKSKERRPFDREMDLQIDKRLTHAQKKSIIGNAQQLNLNFSHGQSKFL